MIPIYEFILAAFSGATLVSALIFFVTSTIPGVSPGHNSWLFSSLSIAIGMLLVLALFAVNQPDIAIFTYKISAILWAAGLHRGLMLFLYKPQDLKPLLLFTATAWLLLGYFQHIYYQPFFSALVFSLYSASLTLTLTWTLFTTKAKDCPKLMYTLTFFLALISLHLLDFPFLYDHPTLAPIGFFVALILTVTINLLLVALSIHKLRLQLEASRIVALDSAARDSLTGLYNRSGLIEAFNTKISQLDAEQQALAVMFIDLDGFKAINDHYGHHAGDKVLEIIASRLKSNTNASEDLVARFGGDEFIIILPFKASYIPEHTIRMIANRLLKCVNEPISHQQFEYQVSASIGISRYPQEGTELNTILDMADQAMYRAKQSGANRYHFAAAV